MLPCNVKDVIVDGEEKNDFFNEVLEVQIISC